MSLRWNNIILAALVAFILLAALRHADDCRSALATVQTLAPNGGADDRFVGFMLLGLLAVALVAIVKLLTQSRRQNPPEPPRDPPEDRVNGGRHD